MRNSTARLLWQVVCAVCTAHSVKTAIIIIIATAITTIMITIITMTRDVTYWYSYYAFSMKFCLSQVSAPAWGRWCACKNSIRKKFIPRNLENFSKKVFLFGFKKLTGCWFFKFLYRHILARDHSFRWFQVLATFFNFCCIQIFFFLAFKKWVFKLHQQNFFKK